MFTFVHFKASGVAASVGVGLVVMRLKRRIMMIVTDITGHVIFTLCAFDTWRILLLNSGKVNSDKKKYFI
jgi:hypothetical protein